MWRAAVVLGCCAGAVAAPAPHCPRQVLAADAPQRPVVHAFHWDADGAYPGGNRDPDSGDRALYNNTPSAWQHYDWSVVTVVDTFTFGGTVDPELLCAAHAHGARVVIGAAAQNSKLWTGPAGLNSSTHRTALAKDIVANVVEQGADGVNLDIEWPPIALRDAISSFVCELSALLRREVPDAQVTFDMAARPVEYEPGTLAYDFATLAECVDHIVMMDYDMATPDDLKANLSVPNSPIPGIRAGINGFVKLGVPAQQLVLAMPWVGMVYPCLGLDPSKELPTGCIPWPPWIRDPANCTIETGFGTIVSELLPLSLRNPAVGTLTRGRQWNATSSTPWFDYVDSSAVPPKRHRVHYDDAESVAAKVKLSTELRLAGVGMWVANALGPYTASPVGKAMWAALRAAPAPPPSPPPPVAWPQPVFHPPQLVSDSPFNDYADGYYMLPRNSASGTSNTSSSSSNQQQIAGGGGVIFGVGAGRFTQSTDFGASWTALPQWDGTSGDPDGYNPAVSLAATLTLTVSSMLQFDLTSVSALTSAGAVLPVLCLHWLL